MPKWLKTITSNTPTLKLECLSYIMLPCYTCHENRKLKSRGCFLLIRCYFIYRLVEGLASADEGAKSIEPKLITATVLSIIYDLPRVYLNVNLFGSFCSFYYNIIKDSSDTITFRVMRGKVHLHFLAVALKMSSASPWDHVKALLNTRESMYLSISSFSLLSFYWPCKYVVVVQTGQGLLTALCASKTALG